MYLAPKRCFLVKKRCCLQKKFLFLAMVCPLRGGGIPLFVKKFSISFFGKLCPWLPPKQKFSLTGIIELTPKTLQNYGFVNIGFTPPPPSFPNPTTPVDLMTKEWYWESVKKLELQVMNKCFNSSHKKWKWHFFQTRFFNIYVSCSLSFEV